MPEQSITVHLNDRPWITTELKSLILRRQSAFNSGNMIRFKILRSKVNRVRKHCRSVYYESKIKDLHNQKPQDW